MGWESSDEVRFDLGPLLQGQTKIAKLKTTYYLLIGPKGCNVKPTYRESLAGILLVCSDLSLRSPSRSNEDS